MIKASDLIEDIWARYNSVYNNAGLFEECETEMAKRVLNDVQAAIEYFDKKDKYKWHDLRKNPYDLPDNGYYDTCSYWHERFQNNRAFYNADKKKWLFHPDNNTGEPWIEDLSIIAWREIEPFKEV